MKYRTILMHSALVFLVAGCVTTTLNTPLRFKQDLPKNEDECLSRNGTWGAVGIPGNTYPPECTISTTDSGKSCKNPEDCEGYCIIPEDYSPSWLFKTGKCSSHYPLFGCVSYLQDGKITSVCMD